MIWQDGRSRQRGGSGMNIKRRDFIRISGIAAVGSGARAGYPPQVLKPAEVPHPKKGIHPILQKDHPYIFVDSCMQIWPDAPLENAHRHGVTAYAVTAWNPRLPVDQALEGLMFWHLMARNHPNIIIASRAEDIERAKKNNQAALILASQCGDFIDYKLHRIEAFYRLGLRMLVLAYSAANKLCDGCLDRTDGGLTSFGQRVVDECNRLGLVLDGSHVGRRASLEIIERSRQPVVFSHSGVNALAENPRNIDDEQIKACAAKGGVIGLSPWGPIILKKGGTRRPTLSEFMEHLNYVAQLLGSTDHIGIGTDMSLGTYPDHIADVWGEATYKNPTGPYDAHISSELAGPLRYVDGFSNYAEIMNVIAELKKRGYGDADIRKILGENYLRVFKQVWR
jgi:membrane dipeptidase